MSTVSAIPLSKVFRIADSGLRPVHISELPGAADDAKRMLDSMVSQTQHREQRVQQANAQIVNAQSNLAHVQSIIEDLPGNASAKDRRDWQRELEGAQSGVMSAQDELALAQNAQASMPEYHLRMQKLVAGLLGTSLDQVRSMYTERLNKLA
jgi:chromosome segregation ATPase